MEALSEEKMSGGGRISLRFVLRLRLIFGFYCAFSIHPVFCFIARLYCLFVAYYSSTVILTGFIPRTFYLILFIIAIIEYNSNVLISFLTGEDHFLNFCKVIQQVDNEFGFADLPLITPTVQNVFLCLVGYRFIFAIMFVTIQFHFKITCTYFIFTSMGFALSINCLNNVMSLDILRHRLGLLRYIFKLNLRRYKWNRMNLDFQVKHANNCVKLYKTLIDQHNVSFSWIKLEIVVRFGCAFATYVILGHDTIAKLRADMIGVVDSILAATLCIFVCTQACLPAIFAELVTREIDKFKIAIGNQLLECDEGPLGAALARAAEYLELRPYRITIWRVCGLDSSLVVSFASLCTTYLIIIIQITGVI